MNKLLCGMVFAVALSRAFGLVLRTKGVSYARTFQWTVENLDDLPDEYQSDYFASDVFRGVLSLKTDMTCNALEIYYGPRNTGYTDDTRFNLNGMVTFKNSTNHVFGKRFIRRTVIANQKKHLLSVHISNVFGKDSLSEVFKMLNNFLVMDFSILITKAQSGSES